MAAEVAAEVATADVVPRTDAADLIVTALLLEEAVIEVDTAEEEEVLRTVLIRSWAIAHMDLCWWFNRFIEGKVHKGAHEIGTESR